MSKLIMPRRQCLGTVGAAAFAALAMPNIARAQTGRLRFSVWREGSEIGSHDMRFTQAGGETVVDIDIDLVVKLLFIPVYDYKHTNRERWVDGRLAGFESETDDNGDPYRVRAEQKGDVILSETLSGTFEHPTERRPTTYWHKGFLERTDWIDSQKGSTVNCTLTGSRQETLDILGTLTETERFTVTGDLKLNLWYRGDAWVKLTFEGEDGSVVEYRILELDPIDMSFA